MQVSVVQISNLDNETIEQVKAVIKETFVD